MMNIAERLLRSELVFAPYPDLAWRGLACHEDVKRPQALACRVGLGGSFGCGPNGR